MKLLFLLFALFIVNCNIKTVHTAPEDIHDISRQTKKTPETHKDLKNKLNSPIEQEQTKSISKTQVAKKESKTWSQEELSQYCYNELEKLPGKIKDKNLLTKACSKVKKFQECNSHEGSPIFHYEKLAFNNHTNTKRILTLSLIHGDEKASGSMSRSWISRLEEIESRNSWRVIPIANPDGSKLNTRMNARKVDLNRNFPTDDWANSALKYWKKKKRSDPRRYPGPSSASEVETRCLIQHIKDFNPDFIISIHTPYGVLDFDGPKHLNFPHFKPLPWISLGNYPGSLGRYMWVDNNTPVLTIELKGDKGVKSLVQFDRLQDISGTVAIQADKVLKRKRTNK